MFFCGIFVLGFFVLGIVLLSFGKVNELKFGVWCCGFFRKFGEGLRFFGFGVVWGVKWVNFGVYWVNIFMFSSGLGFWLVLVFYRLCVNEYLLIFFSLYCYLKFERRVFFRIVGKIVIENCKGWCKCEV